jgi:hypothetical protein
MTKEEQEFWVGRLDGYLDALSMVNGYFRKSRYSAYIIETTIPALEKDISIIYATECDVVFGSLERKEKWLKYLQTELEERLLSEPFGYKSAEDEKHNRIYQVAWYAMEMIQVLSNDFESEVVYQCAIELTCDAQKSEGIVYIIPAYNYVLVLNLLTVSGLYFCIIGSMCSVCFETQSAVEHRN